MSTALLAPAIERDEPRFYIVDGSKRYPSVTTILGRVLRQPHLERWRGEVGNAEADRRMDEGAAIGTEVHQAIALINGDRYFQEVNVETDFADLSVEARKIVGAYVRWAREAIAEVVAAEQTVVSHRWQYAGTCDLVARLVGDDTLTLIDFKTSNAVAREMHLQVSGYQEAWEEGGGEPIRRRMIVWLPKGELAGRCSPRELTNSDGDRRHWLYVVSLWHHLGYQHEGGW